jgi:hypothetical protein
MIGSWKLLIEWSRRTLGGDWQGDCVLGAFRVLPHIDPVPTAFGFNNKTFMEISMINWVQKGSQNVKSSKGGFPLKFNNKIMGLGGNLLINKCIK